MYGEYVKETITPPGWKCQSKAIHKVSVKDKEILTPQGRVQLAPKHLHRHAQQKSYMYPYIHKKNINKLKVRTKQDIQKP